MKTLTKREYQEYALLLKDIIGLQDEYAHVTDLNCIEANFMANINPCGGDDTYFLTQDRDYYNFLTTIRKKISMVSDGLKGTTGYPHFNNFNYCNFKNQIKATGLTQLSRTIAELYCQGRDYDICLFDTLYRLEKTFNCLENSELYYTEEHSIDNTLRSFLPSIVNHSIVFAIMDNESLHRHDEISRTMNLLSHKKCKTYVFTNLHIEEVKKIYVYTKDITTVKPLLLEKKLVLIKS